MLAALLIVTAVFSVRESLRASALEREVSAGYQKAFYETVRLMSNIEANLDKLLITTDRARAQEMLSAVARQADAALSDLALLPAELSAVSGAIKFVNQIGDSARAMNDLLASGEALAAADVELLHTLLRRVEELNQELDDMVVQIESGSDVLMAARYNARNVSLTTLPDELFDNVAEYPTLLYDGPFSDGLREHKLEALTGGDVTQERAIELARAFIGAGRIDSIAVTGESNVPVHSYDIDAQTSDGTLYLSLTQRGGHVLYMLTSLEANDILVGLDGCADAAREFLERNDMPDMELTYWQQAAGLVTFSFVAAQDGVLLYPDMIKVQVSMNSGQVVGYEARGYLSNHRMRALGPPILGEDAAAVLLSEELAVERVRLCVIPLALGEAYCYEFTATLPDGEKYLIYLDAGTGAEKDVFKVIEDNNGQLAY